MVRRGEDPDEDEESGKRALTHKVDRSTTNPSQQEPGKYRTHKCEAGASQATFNEGSAQLSNAEGFTSGTYSA